MVLSCRNEKRGNGWVYGKHHSHRSLKLHFPNLIKLQHNLIGVSRENVDTYPRACGDESEVVIMESNSKITALLGLLMALPITLFWTGVSGLGITLVCLVIFPSEYFLQAALLFTTLFFIVLNVNGWRELRR
jgi:hypothetical protein